MSRREKIRIKKNHFLTLVCQAPDNKHKQRMVRCLCDCGNLTETNYSRWKNGVIKSCGCLQNDAFEPEYSILNRAWGNHHRSAKKRGIINHLSKDEYLSLGSRPCFYCGKFDMRASRKKKGKNTEILFNGVDRLNNEKYYKIENTVPCCRYCNQIKMDATYRDFIERILLIANRWLASTNVQCPPQQQPSPAHQEFVDTK